jgi:hypothetical protein
VSIRRDWFKRQVDILAQAIGTVLALRKKGEIQGAEANLEEAVKKAFGMSGKLALGLPFDDFLGFVCRGELASAPLLADLARLFDQWAAALEETGRAPEAAQARRRAEECRARAATA